MDNITENFDAIENSKSQVIDKIKKYKDINTITYKKPRILVTYIESGMGHIMSMKAIADSLKTDYKDDFEIIETEIMRDTNSEEQIWFENFLTKQTKITNKYPAFGPTVFTFMEIGKQPLMRFVHHTLFRKATEATVEAFRKSNPDIILSTHYFISFCAVEYKRKYNKNAIIVTYNPDNNVHVWWDNRSDLFITNNLLATSEAVYHRNFDINAVKQVFFTARECVIHADGTKQSYREKYNIDKDAFVVMFADGAYADGKGKKFCNNFCKTNKKVTVIFLAGKNKKVYDYFSKKANKIKPNITLKVYPFMNEAYELYAASDIFVTKGGPNAVLDSLYMGTPVLIDYFPHPIEKATCNLFVNKLKCGACELKSTKIKKTIEQMMDNSEILLNYKNNISKNFDKKRNGAKEVGKIIKEAYYNQISLLDKIEANNEQAQKKNI